MQPAGRKPLRDAEPSPDLVAAGTSPAIPAMARNHRNPWRNGLAKGTPFLTQWLPVPDGLATGTAQDGAKMPPVAVAVRSNQPAPVS